MKCLFTSAKAIENSAVMTTRIWVKDSSLLKQALPSEITEGSILISVLSMTSQQAHKT